jgi:hypothetical protein
MSAPHYRLFETSLAALLLADCDEEQPSAGVPAPGQWHNSMGSAKIGEDGKGGGGMNAPLS